jgi:GntR family histidine utilization transcriptional repressor
MSTALHQRITADIASEIRSGAWAPGHRIPFEHELMVRYGCARATVNKAVHALATQGLVQRRRRAGTFVAGPRIQSAVLHIPDIAAEVANRGQVYGWRRLGRRISGRPADPDAARLGCDGPMMAVSGLHLADAKPLALEHRLINLAAVPDARNEPFLDIAPGAWLLGLVAWTEGRHEIAAINPEPDDAKRLGVPRATACLSVKRWTWRLETGIAYARQIFPGDAFGLTAAFTPGAG